MSDPMHPAQRVYAQTVNDAEMEYRRALEAARVQRRDRIQEALRACELALEATPDE